ncbi:MAG: peptide chain release factor N(5)-glutamine methyltransferase [Phycisphaeraceae bacterium]|nr:peptide chain release factor N(5)-glutamine methyltransferase [Phycisphaeraceae bacterium]
MPSPHASPPWTTRRLLAWTADYFTKKNVDSPRLSAELLLAHVLEVERIRLYADLDRPTSDLERAAYRELVERAVRQEPVDYLISRAPFFSLMLEVSPAVLIPRPSTEALVEHVIQHARRTPGFHAPLIADVGTGSGAIAVALAKHIPASRVIATDLSPDALDLARRNAQAHGVADRIEFRQGNLLDPLSDQKRRLRYLVSNPPYIPDDEWDAVAPNVKHFEPTSALRASPDGLTFLRPLIANAHEYLDAPAQLVLEIPASRKQAVLDLANTAQRLQNPRILADHEALPRVLVADAP